MVNGITLKGFRRNLTIAAAAAGLIISFAGSAHAAQGYDLTPTTGDIGGAWAHGSWWQSSDGRYHLNGELKDTGDNDGKGAAFKIKAVYADGGVRYEEVWNTRGFGKTVPIGEYNFASSLRYWELQECILVRSGDGSIHVGYCAPGVYTQYV
ncbi:hypothetical protein PV367_08310 [Streptomyces europaeiscabiei]|uniref:Secreted protein n=1 Tax=Streptomyces europaeiscabiei TaxID=146819 RepID=A0AAJ2PLZ1_9ACTN|nr:hypothetical protein [Streptomyces europaeiscabiei]MDX3129799.1 hypothetical protein [Streptomyces europaeiscabiei]